MAIISKLQLALVGFLLSLFVYPNEASPTGLQRKLFESEWGAVLLLVVVSLSKLFYFPQKICALQLKVGHFLSRYFFKI